MKGLWAGDWSGRLKSKIEERGFDSVQGFLDSVPGASYFDAANLLDGTVAVAQLKGEQLREAVAANNIRYAAKDMLVRLIAYYHRRKGWNEGLHAGTNARSTIADWVATIHTFDDRVEPQLDAVWAALKEASPPVGWRPASCSDQYIERAFNKGWPEVPT